METTVETLSSTEAVRLRELEAIIERGLDTYEQVGNAIAEIHDARLYLQTHRTFEEYLDARWGLKRQRGYELMAAASVAVAVSEKSDAAPPRREAHAKALGPLLRRDPDAAVALWTSLRERYGEALTARHVRDAVNARLAAERERVRRNGTVARQLQLRRELSPWYFDRELRRLEPKLPLVRPGLARVVGGRADREAFVAEIENISETFDALLGWLHSGGLTDGRSGLAPVPPRSEKARLSAIVESRIAL